MLKYEENIEKSAKIKLSKNSNFPIVKKYRFTLKTFCHTPPLG